MTITEAISEKYSIPEEMLYRKSKKRSIAEPRMLAIALLVATGSKQKDMVIKFDLHKPAISHAVSNVRSLVRFNSNFRVKVVEILTKVYDSKEHRQRIIECMMSVHLR